MSEFRIRILAPEDWEIYKSVRLKSLENSPNSFGSTYEREVSFSDVEWQWRLNPKSGTMNTLPLIAEMNGKVVGLASGLIQEPDSKIAHIYQMWVSPAARGKGIGKSFLNEIKTWASDRGCDRLALDVTTSNDAAVSLYVSFGFVPDGHLEELRAGSKHMVQPMIMALNTWKYV